MQTRNSSFALIGSLLFMAACSSTPGEPEGSGSPAREPVPAADVSPAHAGYVHALPHTRFAVGENPAPVSEYGMQKMVGTHGVFATRPTGLVLALANANAPSRAKAPLAGGAAAHDRAVRDYFVAGGLPASQILEVSPYAVMQSSGMGEPTAADMAGAQLAYHYSVVARQLGGVRVADSFAWARLNADGEAVTESVYWPEIPKSVVDQAIAFKTKLATPNVPAWRARLPQGHEGRLVIHHTPGEWTGAFAANVSYDVDVERGKTLHFDSEGRELSLRHEREGAWGHVPETARH